MAEDGEIAVGGHPPIDIGDTFGPDAGTELGIAIWMISEMRPKPVPREKYGEFEDGGAYIILNTIEVGKRYDLFFWLGDKVPVGERGVCAYMVVDLDQHLNDVPVQYRECQGNESSKLLTCLQKEAGGLRVVSGEGGGSAFKHVEAGEGLDFVVTLYEIKGRRTVRMEQKPCHHSSLNEGDVFILDTKEALFMWEGKDANRYEKVRGGEVLAKMCAQRGHHQKMVRLSESPAELPIFWAGIGGEGPVASAEEGGDDAQFEQKAAESLRIFRLGEDGRTYTELTDVEKPFPKTVLDSGGIFLLDSGSATTGIFTWIGKDVCPQLSRHAMTAFEYWLMTQQGKVEGNVPVSRLNESYETQIFKSHFQYPFDPPVIQGGFGEQAAPSGRRSSIAHMRGNEIDLGALAAERAEHKRSVEEARAALDHGGNVLIWRIEKFQKVPLPEEQYGQFCDGDSYIVLHTYEDKNGKEHVVIYFWQGLESSVDEKGASAIEVVRMDTEDFHGHATQVRVVMNKEPESFLILFKGRMIITHGGVDSGFKTKFLCRQQSSVDFESKTNTRMYHVHGTHIFNTKAHEIRARARELHSDDSFVVITDGGIGPKRARVWKGKGASDDEKEIALSAARILLGPDHEGHIEEVNEGDEPDEFWAALGGKEEYVSEPAMTNPSYETRLFHVSNATGGMRVDECFDFSQDDLIVEDVMILDAFNHVLVWVGAESSMEERQAGLETAQKYIESANDGRSADTPVIVVKQQSEPLLFTCHFDNWNDGFFDKMEDVEELLHKDKEEREQKAKEAQLAKVEKHNMLRRQHTADLLAKQEKDRDAKLAMAKEKSDTPSWAKNKLHHIEEGDEERRGSRTSLKFFPGGEEGEGGDKKAPFQPPQREAGSSSPSKASQSSADSPAKLEKRKSSDYLSFRSMDVDAIRAQRKEEEKEASPVMKYSDYNTAHFPYDELKGSGNHPAGVDPTRKELYLSNEQFQELFGQSKEDYIKLPAWKTKTMKQKHDLY